MTTLFISGIDTNVGKSIACGVMANTLLKKGHHIFTQKWVETGSEDTSQDLLTHKKIANQDFNTAAENLHSPYRFSYPASPHLAAKLEKRKLDCHHLITQTKQLETLSDHLLIEGAGGLCVPLDDSIMIVDLISQLKLPTILVTCGRLGSINHTILSLELCRQRGIEVRAIIYNQFPAEEPTIVADTRQYIQHYLDRIKLKTLWIELPIDAFELNMSNDQISFLLDEQGLDHL